MINHSNKAENIFNTLSSINASPKTELVYTTPFTLLIAVLLSAQATDKQVNIATRELFKIADTPLKMLNLKLEEIENHVKTIGLYHNKAKNILLTSKILYEEFDSKIPETREQLETLPGVGRKTANVILNELYQQPTIAVDTHIFRVANRTGLACGKTPLEVEKKLYQVIPSEYQLHAHHQLILHGRYICRARKPQCEICPIFNDCDYSE